MMRRALAPLRTRSTLALGGVVVALAVSTTWLRINVSPSVPYGLYRLTAIPKPLPRGTLVLFAVPPEMRAWHSMWLPLLKPVAGIEGDEVCVQDHILTVTGRDYGWVFTWAEGHRLPEMVGCFRVMPGDVFVASDMPRSLDSRYFGSVQITSLTAQAVPVWTW